MAEIDITPILLKLTGEKKKLPPGVKSSFNFVEFRNKINTEVLAKVDQGNPDKDEFISQIKKDDDTYKLFQELADPNSNYLTKLDCVDPGEISEEDINNFDKVRGNKKDGKITIGDFVESGTEKKDPEVKSLGSIKTLELLGYKKVDGTSNQYKKDGGNAIVHITLDGKIIKTEVTSKDGKNLIDKAYILVDEKWVEVSWLGKEQHQKSDGEIVCNCGAKIHILNDGKILHGKTNKGDFVEDALIWSTKTDGKNEYIMLGLKDDDYFEFDSSTGFLKSRNKDYQECKIIPQSNGVLLFAKTNADGLVTKLIARQPAAKATDPIQEKEVDLKEEKFTVSNLGFLKSSTGPVTVAIDCKTLIYPDPITQAKAIRINAKVELDRIANEKVTLPGLSRNVGWQLAFWVKFRRSHEQNLHKNAYYRALAYEENSRYRIELRENKGAKENDVKHLQDDIESSNKKLDESAQTILNLLGKVKNLGTAEEDEIIPLIKEYEKELASISKEFSHLFKNADDKAYMAEDKSADFYYSGKNENGFARALGGHSIGKKIYVQSLKPVD